jgi:putative transposase
MHENGINNRDAGYHSRRSVRLQGYDYSRSGAYFMTICVRDRECLFGEIADGKMELNPFGKIVSEEWKGTFQIRHELKMDEYVIMPNHFHGIIVIRDVPVGATRRVAHNATTVNTGERATQRVAPTNGTGPESGSIGAIIGQFKSISTKRINRLRNTPGHPVWQRNYYDHIIRDEKSLFQIRTYIRNNPSNWDSDEENPVCGRPPRYVALPNPQKAFMAV